MSMADEMAGATDSVRRMTRSALIAVAKVILPSAIRPQACAERRWRRICGNHVHSGPFSGMAYGGRSIGSASAPKLMGVYEREIHQVLYEICATRPSCIVNAGAAEGYYAVGMARLCPDAEVIAFESDERGRKELSNLAFLNGVSHQVVIRGECRADDLEPVLKKWKYGVLVCDIEGGEFELFSALNSAALWNWIVLIELHEFQQAGVERALRDRFETTHRIRQIPAQLRTVDDIPEDLRHRFLDRWTVKYLYEFRPAGMSWLIAIPQKLACEWADNQLID